MAAAAATTRSVVNRMRSFGLTQAFSTRSTPIKKRFEAWCKEHGKTYPSEQEKERRYQIFRKNYKLVQQHNRSNASYTCALNVMADYAQEDMHRLHMAKPIDLNDKTVYEHCRCGQCGNLKAKCGCECWKQDFNNWKQDFNK